MKLTTKQEAFKREMAYHYTFTAEKVLTGKHFGHLSLGVIRDNLLREKVFENAGWFMEWFRDNHKWINRTGNKIAKDLGMKVDARNNRLVPKDFNY